MLKREWADAVAAHEGWPCRVCLRHPRELAHVIGRARDERRSRTTAYVHPLDVVPLCREHHVAYDAHELDLLPHLLPAELERAIQVAGSREAALRRIRGIHHTPEETH